MDADSAISPEVLARYAGDAAQEVEGVAGFASSHRSRAKPVAISGDEDTIAVSVALELEWGRSAEGVAVEVQKRVSEYLARMANMTPASVDVVFDAVSSPPPKR